MLTRPWSSSSVARSSSRLSRGSPNRAFKSPIRIKSNPVCAVRSASYTQCKLGLSFCGTYAPTTYYYLAPDVSRNLTVLGRKLAVFSTFHFFAAHQTTATPSQFQLSASVPQTSYPVPCWVWIPYVKFVSCRNPTSTFPWGSAQSAVSSPPALPVWIFNDFSLILPPVTDFSQPVLTLSVRFWFPCPMRCGFLRTPPQSVHQEALPNVPFSGFPWTPYTPSLRLPICTNSCPFPRSESFFPSDGFLPPVIARLLPFYPRRPISSCHPPPVVHLASLRSGRTGQ